MKLKITHTQLECLCRIMNYTLKAMNPVDNVDRLLHCHMSDLHKVLVKKFIDSRKVNTISLTDSTAIAFYEYWQNVNIEDVYARNIINGINKSIDSLNLVKSI